MKNKGFTLVELLAVIAILAILVIIALPNVLSMFNSAKKDVFLTEAKNIYKEVSKKYITETMKGNKVENITNSNNKLDIESNDLNYNIKLDTKGNIKDFQVSNDTYCLSGKFDNLGDLTIDKIKEGECEKPGNCKFDGKLVKGAEYVNGQYTYRYQQSTYEAGEMGREWIDAGDKEGWGVRINDENAESITSELCTYINDKPVIYMTYTFFTSRAHSVDLSSFDTSNVINMRGMFEHTTFTNLDLSNFNTSNVTDMGFMFYRAFSDSINVSSFDTSKVTDMAYMFSYNKYDTLDISNFDTSKVTDMNSMFSNVKMKKILVGDKFNTINVTKDSSMFNYAESLVGGQGTAYDKNHIDKEYARIDGGISSPGYFTKK